MDRIKTPEGSALAYQQGLGVVVPSGRADGDKLEGYNGRCVNGVLMYEVSLKNI